MTKNKISLNGLGIKLIAIILMTIDHIGMFFLSGNSDAQIIMRSIGRLAFPLFVFLAIEGVYHSRHPLRYGLILLGLGIAFDFILWPIDKSLMGNVFTDLGCGIIVCHLLKNHRANAVFALIPATFIVLTSIFPQYLHSDYGVYGLLMFVFFFIAYEFSTYQIRKQAARAQIDEELALKKYQRHYRNVSCALMLLLEVCLFYLLFKIDYDNIFLPFSFNIESWSMFAGVIFLLYNGKRGFSNKIVKYGFYAYYPLHVVVLYFIASALNFI